MVIYMKNFKRMFTFAVSLSISMVTLSFSGLSSSAENKDADSIDMDYLYNTNRNAYSVELFQDFVESFPVESTDGVKTTIFPNSYGGAYIDDNNVLHVKVVNDENTTDYGLISKNYISTFEKESNVNNLDKDIIIENAKVNLTELLKIQNILELVMIKYDISSIYTDEQTNTLNIALLDDSKKDDILTYLKENFDGFDDGCIVFVEGSAISTTASNTTSNALAGSSSSSSAGTATLGFNAYKSSTGKYGVVTAAHFATSGTTIYNAKGTSIGSANVRQFSGSIDAAFVPFGSSITQSKRINQLSSPNDTLTGYYSNNSSIIQGMNTTKVGNTSGVNYGTVLSSNVSVVASGTLLSNQVKLSNTQLAGDSGGPVFYSLSDERVC